MSGSMRVGSKIALARQAYDSILTQLRDGEDELGLFTFDNRLHERQSFTSKISGLKGALDEFKAFGATSLYDATEATARRLAERSAAHKAIIILTDGIDTSSRLSAPEVSGVASSIDVPGLHRGDRRVDGRSHDRSRNRRSAGRYRWRGPARSG